jgi:hypothetical protein
VHTMNEHIAMRQCHLVVLIVRVRLHILSTAKHKRSTEKDFQEKSAYRCKQSAERLQVSAAALKSYTLRTPSLYCSPRSLLHFKPNIQQETSS